jgi:hypothetical protein
MYSQDLTAATEDPRRICESRRCKVIVLVASQLFDGFQFDEEVPRHLVYSVAECVYWSLVTRHTQKPASVCQSSGRA